MSFQVHFISKLNHDLACEIAKVVVVRHVVVVDFCPSAQPSEQVCRAN